MRRAAIRPLVAVLLVVATAATAAVVLLRPTDRTAAADTTATPPVTATVERTDLVDEQVLDGSVGYGAAVAVGSGGSGVVTAVPEPGTVVEPGDALFRVDDQPVVLFDGDTPFFRALAAPDVEAERGGAELGDGEQGDGDGPGGDDEHGGEQDDAPDGPTTGRFQSGADVAVLKANLAALGYPVGTRTDPVYTPALAEGVRRWQADVGLRPTGVLDPTRVVVHRGAVRVDAVLGAPGAPADQPVLAVTATERVVTVPFTAAQAAAFPAGTPASITLPDGTALPATVRAVRPGSRDQGAPPSTGEVVADDPASLDAATGPSVRVAFAAQTREDVLAVPVEALLALAGGGYALELADGTLLAVETGMTAHGLVEVDGDGVAEGLEVVTAS